MSVADDVDSGGETVPATPHHRTQVGRPASEPEVSASAPTVADTGGDLDLLPAIDPKLYAIGIEIGRGGMGRVLAARDRKLRRDLVIKLLRDASHTARFQREALITARLQHPSIVRVYDAGVLDDEPFYAMEHVRGKTLDRVVAEAEDAGARLALLPRVIAVADALAYAHSEGVIHRDLKPANILLGEFGETIVIDWGLAKDLRAGDPDSIDPERRVPGPRDSAPALASDLTAAGAVMGTPSYMPPEQARGERADERSDVYAIGAILYTVIAGAPPVSGAHALDDARAGGITPLAERAPDAPEELVTIVEHAMAYEPADRYATARELADDLRRFAAGQLVARHAYTRGDLIRRWLRRYRAPLIVAAAVLAVVGALAFVRVRRLATERDEARADAERLTAAYDVTQREADDLAIAQAERELGHDPSHALAWLRRLSRRGLDRPVARELADEAARRGVAFELVGPEDPIGRVVTTGANTAYSTGDRTLWRWQLNAFGGTELATHDAALRALAISPDRFGLATGGDDASIRLWNLNEMRHRVLAGHTASVLALAFSPDGDTLASAGGDGALWLWTVATGEGARVHAHGKPLGALAWSNDGARLWAGTGDGQVLELEVATKQTRSIAVHDHPIAVLAVSPDGSRVAAGGPGGAVLWTATERRPRPVATGPVHDLAWTPRSALVIAQDHQTVLHDGLAEATRIAAGSLDVDVALDGSIAVAGVDGSIYLISPASDERRVLAGHRGPVTAVAFTQGGSRLVSASGDRLRLWPLAPPPPAPAGRELATWLRSRTNVTVAP